MKGYIFAITMLILNDLTCANENKEVEVVNDHVKWFAVIMIFGMGLYASKMMMPEKKVEK